MMKRFTNVAFVVFLSILMLTTICCNPSHSYKEKLDLADSIIESRPDSALAVLSSIEKERLRGSEDKARYALLMSMALDKNYIDTTTFDVLQPAIDYYLKKGNADEKLRTYYYQGRIYYNQRNLDSALNSFIKAIDVSKDSKDSLTIARTLVAQSSLYNEFYDFNACLECDLKAAKIYRNLSKKWNEFDCLLNALNGSILLSEKPIGDSILNLCVQFKELDNRQKENLKGYKLSYILEFGSKKEIKDFIDSNSYYSDFDVNGLLNLAYAFNEIGDYKKAKNLLHNISEFEYDTLKYQAIMVSVLENKGDYKGALSVYKKFSQKMDSINGFKFDQKARSIEEKHKLELKAEHDARVKTKIIWSCIGGILFLIFVAFILFLLFRSNKTQKKLAEERAKTSELENEKLKSESEKKTFENKNLQLERDKKALEAENLSHRVEILESERANLKELIDSQEELPSEVRQAIKVRIEMLNALMAGYITENEKYEKPYESWIKNLTENTEEFMNSNRLAFQASHPRFIQYFEEHNLTVNEINYVCLYAIGLRGKDVGKYINKPGHVNMSSTIRKKLGIDKHETNIGIYVRKLLKQL